MRARRLLVLTLCLAVPGVAHAQGTGTTADESGDLVTATGNPVGPAPATPAAKTTTSTTSSAAATASTSTPSAASSSGGSLPNTGSDPVLLLLAGGALVATGAGLRLRLRG